MNVTQVKGLLNEFWQRRSDACPLECTEAENEEFEFSKFVEDKIKNSTFEDSSSFLMKHIAENYHPHMKAIVQSDSSELVEGKKVCLDDSFILD